MKQARMLVIAVAAVVVTGCGGSGSSAEDPPATADALASTLPSPTPSTTAAPVPAEVPSSFDVVIIGDSLTDPSHCPGCTGFGEQYRSHLEERLGAPVTYHRIETMDVPAAVQTVTEDEAARSMIADAEVVVVQVGYNNALPDPETGIGCGGSLGTTEEQLIDWVLSTQLACMEQGVATYGQLYDQIFAGIAELRRGLPTVSIVTNTLDGNNDPSEPGGLLQMSPSRSEDVLAWTLAAYERWNQMVAERAQAAGFVLVDIWHEFNGPDGSAPMGELSIDGAHPSQAGNDLIAALLAEVDISVLTGQQAGS